MISSAAIIVVTYNSAGVIDACLDAALASGAEVIVVDNASPDGTAERVRRRSGVRLIANATNRGFAAAVNQGVAATEQPFLLLLNPDAILEEGLDLLVKAAQEAGAGASTGQLLDMDGRFQGGFAVRRLCTPASLVFESLGINRLWPGNQVNRRFRCQDFDGTKMGYVEQPPGAFLLFSRVVFTQLGGFDERFYPLWFEDVDFCKRLKDKGLLIVYEPRAKARHQGGHSVHQLPWEGKVLYWYGSLLKYSAKHFSRLSHRMVALGVMGGAMTGLVVGILVRRSLEPLPVYGKVIRSACRSFFLCGDGGGGVKNSTGKKLIDQAQIHGL